jgi:hypothetical protein
VEHLVLDVDVKRMIRYELSELMVRCRDVVAIRRKGGMSVRLLWEECCLWERENESCAVETKFK